MKHKLLLILLTLALTGCNAKDNTKSVSKAVDFESFKEGRPCADVLFGCLPESVDKSWQVVALKDGADSFELTAKRLTRYKNIIKTFRLSEEERKKQKMLITDLDKDFHKKVEAKQFLIDMEQNLAKEFEGFWKDVPKKVRYRWIRRAMAKSKKLGYGDGEITDNIQVIELCARIGLDFDLDPKWKYIVDFIKHKDRGNRSFAGIGIKYIDFTIFNKDIDMYGRPINDWSLRTALRYLPYPKRPIPSLHE